MRRNSHVLWSLYLVSVVSHVRSQHQRDETKLVGLNNSMALSVVQGQVDMDKGYVNVPIVGSAAS